VATVSRIAGADYANLIRRIDSTSMLHQAPPQHILVVDDETMIQEALKMLLIHEGDTVLIW